MTAPQTMAKREGAERTHEHDGVIRRALTVISWGILGGAAGQMFEIAFPDWFPAHWVALGAGGLAAALAGAGIFRAYRHNPGALLASQLREANRLFKNGQLSKREYEHIRATIIRQTSL
jgi:hypothetical protein